MSVKIKRLGYLDDCKRIQNVLHEHNYDVTLAQCQDVWEQYSIDREASWLILPASNENIWACIEDIVEPIA